MGTFPFLIYLLVVVESREVEYSLVHLDGPAIMEYSVSVTGVAASECGMLCTTESGCKLFHYNSRKCYILNSPGTSSMNITTFYGSETWRESCTMTDFPLFGGKYCMKIFDVKVDWTTANTTCSQDGGQLLSMKSNDFFLKKEVLRKTGQGYKYWINGNDLNTEGDWRWGGGSKIQTDQWVPGNPSNTKDNEHCLLLRFNILFNDANCIVSHRFICEKKKL